MDRYTEAGVTPARLEQELQKNRDIAGAIARRPNFGESDQRLLDLLEVKIAELEALQADKTND